MGHKKLVPIFFLNNKPLAVGVNHPRQVDGCPGDEESELKEVVVQDICAIGVSTNELLGYLMCIYPQRMKHTLSSGISEFGWHPPSVESLSQ